MYSIDLQQARNLLVEAVKVKGGDHKETSCRYVVFEDEDGEIIPATFGCIVGTAVASLIGLPLLTALVNSNDGLNVAFVSDAMPRFGITATPEAMTYLRRAQDAQDANHLGSGYRATWAEAVDYAESFL